MPADRFVDTNVLLTATATLRPGHVAAVALLNAGFGDRTLYLSGQVLREYLALATRPPAANGLGLPMASVIENTQQFLDRANFLAEDAAVRDTLVRVLRQVECSGKQVHDANIVAPMLAHGVRNLVTLNPRDFERFASSVDVLGLSHGEP